jgi:hypothetical protein
MRDGPILRAAQDDKKKALMTKTNSRMTLQCSADSPRSHPELVEG